MSGPAEVWGAFTRDPRLAVHSSLRASDADRDVVHQVLAEAYADGRLDREELESRTDAVAGARTLGELPPLLSDLVPTSAGPAVPAGGGLLSASEIEQRAVSHWQRERRSAVSGFVIASVICWTIWATVMFGGFPWPVFVMLGTGVNALQTMLGREEAVARERRRLEKRQRRELEAHRDGEDG